MWCTTSDEHVLVRRRPRTATPGSAPPPRGRTGARRRHGSRRRPRRPATLGRPAGPRPARPGARPAGTARRRRPGRPCAAPRGAPARPAAPRASAARSSSTGQPQRDRACCTSRSAPPAGRGTTAAAARTTAAPAPGAPTPPAPPGRATGVRQTPPRGRPRSASRTDGPDVDVDAEHRADPADQPGGEQRMAAQGEEVVVDADRRPCRGPRRTAGTGSPRARWRARDRLRAAVLGCRQGGAVELPVAGQRQRVEHDHGRGHHVLGQAAAGVACAGSSGRSVSASARARRRRPAVGRRDVLARDAPRPARQPGVALRTASISPGSMRKPRILTWLVGPADELDARRRRVHRARSPVRYIRSPAPNGQATNRSAVSAARPT